MAHCSYIFKSCPDRHRELRLRAYVPESFRKRSFKTPDTLFLPISLTFALGHLFQLYLTETFVTLLLFVSPVLNLPCSCPPLCILLALLLTIRVRPGLNYSLRFTLLISLIAFVCLFIYLFIYLLI